ncbi:hypothetical protein GGS24DRAFT_446274 [Hypoxylon argillaceum]|nr:hypothetical protein GGS24DRAFT_446274 [Hypoxylon argillaceum]
MIALPHTCFILIHLLAHATLPSQSPYPNSRIITPASPMVLLIYDTVDGFSQHGHGIKGLHISVSILSPVS